MAVTACSVMEKAI